MDLKPCPFCGSDAELIDAPEPMNEGCVVVECTKCHASTCVSYAVKDDPRPVVIDAWNRRHEDAELARLRAELKAEKDALAAEHTVLMRLNAELAAAGIVDGKAPYYRADGTFELVPIAEWIERRKCAAKLHEQTRTREAELAAALEAIRMHVRDQYIHFPGHGTLTIGEYIDKQDTRTILAARDARRDPEIKRKGAAWALRTLDDEDHPLTKMYMPADLDILIERIERGEVEVGG